MYARFQLSIRKLRLAICNQVELKGSASSQFLTALLMASPLAKGSEPIEIIIVDTLVSEPYVDMTVKLMERFGVIVERLDGLSHMRVSSISEISLIFSVPACNLQSPTICVRDHSLK